MTLGMVKSSMNKKYAALTAIAALSIALTSAITQLGGSTPITPCPTEDSMNCYWDATLSGNGEGRSFLDIDGLAYYAD